MESCCEVARFTRTHTRLREFDIFFSYGRWQKPSYASSSPYLRSPLYFFVHQTMIKDQGSRIKTFLSHEAAVFADGTPRGFAIVAACKRCDFFLLKHLRMSFAFVVEFCSIRIY